MNIKMAVTGRPLRLTTSGAYLLFVICLVSMNQYVGQYLFSVALEPIKAEFKLSDSQLGAINGPAFLLFFGIAGIPIAGLAERMGRRKVIAVSIAAWSALTAATALATGFVTLLLTRALIGISQSGCNPAAQSLIAARFPPHKRSGAMSVMYASLFLGVLFGLALGSILVRTLGWRGAFLATGAWGVVLVPLVWLTLREPPLSVHASKDTVLCDLLAIIRSRGILHYLVMYAIMGLTTTGTIMWSPSFYSRYYGMDAAQAGVAVGFILGGGSLCGSLFGGLIITRLGRKGGDRASSFMMWATFVSIPAAIGAFLVNNSAASLALLLFWTIAACLPAGHILAIVHGLVEPRHRSVAAALTLLAASIGGGIGPLLVGVISDLVGTSNRGALRIALLGTSVLNIWALIHMYALVRCSRSLGYRES